MQHPPVQWRARFEDENAQRLVLGAQVDSVLIIILLPLFGLLDLYAHHEAANTMLVVRGVGTLAAIALFLLLRLAAKNGRLRRHLRQVIWLIFYNAVICVDLLILLAGGAESPYYAGLCLILLGMFVSLPYSLTEMASHAGVIWAQYVAVMLLFDSDFADARPFVSNNFFMVSIIVVGLVWAYLTRNLHVKEFVRRMQLAERDEALREEMRMNVRTLEELTRANEVKEHFVATLSHELRNPITVIAGAHSVLLDTAKGSLNAEQMDWLLRAQKCTLELEDVIAATLDLSRFEAGQTPLRLQETDPATIAAELAAEIRVTQEKPHLSLLWEVPEGLPLIRTDPLKLKMILRNLVGNALKFTDRGYVRVQAQALNGGIEIRVSDTGIGIPAASLPTIFEPFRQAHQDESARRGGVGLGLHIVQRLVAVLGGTVAAASEEGRGSTFRVWLPKSWTHSEVPNS